MEKLLLVIGALLAVTVSRTDGKVTLTSNTQKVSSGRTVSFSCQVTDGESFVAWVTPAKPAHSGNPAIPSERITTSSTGRRRISVSGNTFELTIELVTVDDGGEYICQGSVEKATFTLEVDFSTADVVPKQGLRLGEEGIIRLDVSSYPLPTYQWTKDGQPLTFPAQGRTLDKYTGSITIANVKQSDQGDYSCKITLGTSATVKIEVTVIDEPKIRKYQGDPVYRRLTQGNSAIFHCDILSGSPKPTVTWWFGWTDTTKKVDIQYDPRYSHPTEETWNITGIETKDIGKYRCRAKNTAGEAFLRFEITHVDIAPTIDPLSDVVANDGQSVDLECLAAGTPTPTVEWFYRGSFYNRQTSFMRQDKKVAKISFSNVNLVNTGEYTCRAKNGALDSNSQLIVVKKSINLYVRSAPKINEDASPTPVYSFVGNRNPVTITCTFFGYPVPTVIIADTNGTEIARGNSSASKTFVTTSEGDFGMYNCSAQSPDGNAQYLVEFKKAVPPGPPRNVAANKTCKEITLYWQPPLDNGGMEIANYIIKILQENNQEHSENVDRRAVEQRISYEFKPSTRYEVRLNARSEAGSGNEETLFVKTDQFCVPGKPRITNSEYEVDRENFILTWNAPQYNGGDNNTKYRLEWRKKPITEDTEVGAESNIGDTRFKITGLEPDAEYEIRLYSVNRQGDSEPDIRTFKTNADAGEPAAGTGKLGAGAIAGIVIAIILIVLIVIDFFCCFFNSCGLMFCCHQALCGGGGGGSGEGAGAGAKDDYMDGKATEMEKKPLDV